MSWWRFNAGATAEKKDEEGQEHRSSIYKLNITLAPTIGKH